MATRLVKTMTKQKPQTTSGRKNVHGVHGVELSVVIPVYRSQKTLPALVNRLVHVLKELGEKYEIILVEDCGGDNSWAVIESLQREDLPIYGFRLSRNFGQHAATLCGIAQSKGDWIVTIDDDLEHEPEHIPLLIDKARENHDIVYGVFPYRTHTSWRNITSNVIRKLLKFAIPTLNREYSSFRVIRGDLARQLTRFDSAFPFVDGYLSWITNNYATVSLVHGDRDSGKSNYTFAKLVIHTANIFVTFSDLPLRIASWVGFGAATAGIIWLLWIVILRIMHGITVSGFASVMAAILCFSGIQLLILGILGQYIARINFKTTRKPLFVIAEDSTKNNSPR
jgi:polyisoprenyl-phosphate glycosyltransferase